MPAPGQHLERTVSKEFSQQLLREVLDVVEALEPPAELLVEVFRAASSHAGQLTLVDGPIQVARNGEAFRNPR